MSEDTPINDGIGTNEKDDFVSLTDQARSMVFTLSPLVDIMPLVVHVFVWQYFYLWGYGDGFYFFSCVKPASHEILVCMPLETISLKFNSCRSEKNHHFRIDAGKWKTFDIRCMWVKHDS